MKSLQAALAVLALTFMGALVARQWSEIPDVPWSIRPGLLLVSLLGLVMVLFLSAYGWHLVLRAIGQSVSCQRSVRIWMLSSVVRYIPGGIWGYASRSVMARTSGVGLATSSMSVYLESILVAATATGVGFAAMLIFSGLPVTLVQALCVWGGLSLLLHPKAIGLVRFLPGSVGRAFAAVQLPRWRQLLGLYAYYLSFWVLFGLVFALFVYSLYPIYVGHWPYVGASLGLAFSAGFVAVAVPGGIGVRESVLCLLLMNVMPPTASLIVALASRLWNIAGEMLCVLLVILWRQD